ncbi:MAG: hypothetical protein LC768_17400 [Acidobacteria bacterium]|nr:hypothetical protein [Acidobacteriota bacterium]MCA1640069.1 hypothetical protein [Acidobacteriota bacterium]
MPLRKEKLHSGELIQKDSELICDGEVRRDTCHYNFVGWNEGMCKRFIAPLAVTPENFVICDEGKERHLTLEDILKWKEENPDF